MIGLSIKRQKLVSSRRDCEFCEAGIVFYTLAKCNLCDRLSQQNGSQHDAGGDQTKFKRLNGEFTARDNCKYISFVHNHARIWPNSNRQCDLEIADDARSSDQEAAILELLSTAVIRAFLS